MKSERKIAIIGCGSISTTHIAAITSENLASIVGLCDIREDRLQATSKTVPGAALFSDYKEMIENVNADVIHVCTPHYLHAEMAIYAMRHGCDVYLEKPCAMDPDEAKEIIKVSDETGRKVCVSFQNRLINTTVSAKEIIASGKLGKLVGAKGIVTWKRGGAYYSESGWRGKFATEGGGVLMNQSIHTLDLMYYFLGKPIDVRGNAMLYKNYDVTEVEDTANAYITFEGGKTGIFYATNCNTVDSSVELELYLEKGRLLIREEALYMIADGVTEKICENENIILGKGCWGNGHVRMISAFYNALDGMTCYYCDIRDAYQVLEIIEGIYKNSEIHP